LVAKLKKINVIDFINIIRDKINKNSLDPKFGEKKSSFDKSYTITNKNKL
jgi:hypothetical protein